MRTALTLLAVIVCAAVLASGYLHWKDKTNVSSFSKVR